MSAFEKKQFPSGTDGKKTINYAKRKDAIFLFFFLLFPVVQFAIFYIGVNFNSILLSFKAYDGVSGKYYLAGFATYKEVLQDIFVNGALTLAIKNSLIQFLVNLALGIPIHVMVAYAIFKKIPGSGFFKIMLFMPSMISSMVFVVCAEQIIMNGFPVLFGESAKGLLDKFSDKSFWTVLIFGYWMNFAGGLIVYLGAMSSVSQDVMEYDKLERLNSIKELWYVVVPLIFPTITTYIVVAFAGFFTNYGFFYAFFDGAVGSFDTLGYIFFVKVAHDSYGISEYPYASAGGLMFTLVLTPVTLGVKGMLEKFGPSED